MIEKAVVLGILQNQWFDDPEKVRGILANNPQARRRLIAYALFAGCRTGRILKRVFGEDLCKRITWEEASPEIGARASSKFPADMPHLLGLITTYRPKVVLAFGDIACRAMAELRTEPVSRYTLILGPHPANRRQNNESRLIQMKIRLKELIV